MKIRNGFVSNSSSSSFVVAFPKDFDITKENVHQYVFNGSEGYFDYYDSSASYERAADVITDDMLNQQPNDLTAINEAINGSYTEDGPELEEFRIPSKDNKRGYEYDWKAYGEAVDAFTLAKSNSLNEQWKDMNLYVFRYSDNDGDFWSAMEHGGTFDNVPHECFNHH